MPDRRSQVTRSALGFPAAAYAFDVVEPRIARAREKGKNHVVLSELEAWLIGHVQPRPDSLPERSLRSGDLLLGFPIKVKRL